jgi:type IV secretory pathway VirD2 relaxase
LRAVARMNKHWEGLMEEFHEYKTNQMSFGNRYSVLRDADLQLSPDDEARMVIITDDEGMKEMLKTHKKSDDYRKT